MILSIIIVSITIIYLALIGMLTYGFDNEETFHLQDLPNKTHFTVIVPFRNESKHLPNLLYSLKALNYKTSHFEIIFVDDNSTDDSVELINRQLGNCSLTYRIISLPSNSISPKKEAISKAIDQAKNEWIITTDADCVLPKYWLDSYDQFIATHNVICVAGPVVLSDPNNYLKKFQALDFLSLQGATVGGFGINFPFLCNGANLAYKAEMFKVLSGFDGNKTVSSGDDIFILEKMLKHDAKKVKYLKSETAIVDTFSVKNLKELIHQRVRWASKASKYQLWYTKLIGIIVLLANFVFIALLPLFLMEYISQNVTVSIFIIKISIDFLLIFKAARFLGQEHVLSSYMLSCIIYPFFNVYIAAISPFKSFIWKDRTSHQ